MLEVRGRVGALLATDAGLIGVLTGRENAELLGVLAGLGVGEARAAVGRVQDLSGLGEAFDLPVSSYSQGMRARLGFATAVQREIDLLLLDEVHEALDHEFRAVVAERAEAIRARGGIVVAAGHDHATLEALCDRAVRLGDGAIAADGAFGDVVDATCRGAPSARDPQRLGARAARGRRRWRPRRCRSSAVPRSALPSVWRRPRAGSP